MTAALYVIVVLIWGVTWIAIHYQIGPVAVELSILYRFSLASALLFVLLISSRRLDRLNMRDHLICLGQGLTLFCCNFVLVYHAEAQIPSGLVAVVFSTASVWTALLSRVAFGFPLRAGVIAGACFGLPGLWLLFGIDPGEIKPHLFAGLALALGGTMCFAVGNLFGVMHQRRGRSPLTTAAWGMLYGTLLLAGLALIQDLPWQVDLRPTYLGALAYLAVFGSVIGFTAYLTLVGRIGADRAAYATVLFPLVALNVSALVEGYVWTAGTIVGAVLVLAGNVLVFAPLGRSRAFQ